MTESRNTGRMALVAVLLLAVMLGLAYRLTSLHLYTADSVRARVDRVRRMKKTIDVARGRILDSKQNVLAMDLAMNDIVADPSLIIEQNCVGAVVSNLAVALEKDPAEIMARIDKPDRRFEYVERYVPDDRVRALKDLRLPGIRFNDVLTRYYPQGSLMCHVLGFVNRDGVGSAGIEMGLNRFMVGSKGYMESELDGRRRELRDRRTREVAPLEGADVVLCLDQNIQYAVEKVLDDVMAESQARGACAIVQRIKTGEILAMASRPGYDLNKFHQMSDDEFLNRAIGLVYEPGSTMKIVAVSGVLEEKLATPGMMLDCENGAWFHAGRILRDVHPYGRLTVADIVKKSSNIGTAKLALMLGEDRLHSYFRKFGFGAKSRVDLAGEETGILHPRSRWSNLSCSRMAIGQGIAVTAEQMLNAMCTIANDGIMMKPYIVKRVVAKDGRVLLERKPEQLGRAISRETAATMRTLLARVTEDGGTGTKGRVDGYTVAGKTGTAQKPEAGGYSSTKFVSSFVGFLPAETPEIGVIVVVDEPKKAYYGGLVAAPAFGKIAAQTVHYLDIPRAPATAYAAVSGVD